MWSFVGLGIALAMAALAWRRARAPGGFYDADVYAMTPQTHRTYALAFAGFAIALAMAAAFADSALGVALLAVLVLLSIFYGASFLRGAPDADE